MTYLLQELNYLAQKVDQLEERLEMVEKHSEKLKKAEQVAQDAFSRKLEDNALRSKVMLHAFHGGSGKRGKPPTKP